MPGTCPEGISLSELQKQAVIDGDIVMVECPWADHPAADDVSNRVARLEEMVHDLAKKLSRQTAYFDLLIGVLHHHSVIDENQFAAATKALDRELMNQQLRTNITEEEDGK